MRPTNRTTWILLFSFLGLAAFESPGCSNEVDKQDFTLKGECEPAGLDEEEPVDDPCTLEGCKGQPNAHVITPGLPCGLNNDLTCTVTGACGGCTTADQCGDSTACLPWVCDVDKICRQTPSPNGQKVQSQIPGDCKEVQCDGAGGEKTVNVNDAPTYDCYTTTCSQGAEVKTPTAQGTACTMGGGKSCDGEGNCVKCNTDADCGPSGIFCDPKSNTCFTCSDNMKNGDESDVDCGGIRCARCSQGEGCAIAGDCTTNFCADSICCTSACDQPCEACNLPTSPGACDYITKYEPDPSYGMGMSCMDASMKTCNGAGACKGAFGATCASPTDCASAKCNSTTKTCVYSTGEACDLPSDCFSGTCTGNICG